MQCQAWMLIGSTQVRKRSAVCSFVRASLFSLKKIIKISKEGKKKIEKVPLNSRYYSEQLLICKTSKLIIYSWL